MSHPVDYCYECYHETLRCARKEHRCDACEGPIRRGDRYFTVFIADDGVEFIKRCLRCQRLHEHLRSLAPGDMWPEEKLDCGESYDNEWGEPPDDIIELAFMTPDEAQRKLLNGVKS